MFFQIILPISKPVLATIGLFLAFGYWNDWFQAQLYISDSRLHSLQAMLNAMQNNLEYLTKNPSASASITDLKRNMPQESVRMAIAFVVAVPIACVYPFFQKYFISGLTVGAVKGCRPVPCITCIKWLLPFDKMQHTKNKEELLE